MGPNGRRELWVWLCLAMTNQNFLPKQELETINPKNLTELKASVKKIWDNIKSMS
jgi:hypothetical protein